MIVIKEEQKGAKDVPGPALVGKDFPGRLKHKQLELVLVSS
jgi:hypothetical protein